MTDLRRLGLEAAVILLVGAALGLSLNFRLVLRTFTDGTVSAVPSTPVAAQAEAFPEPASLAEVRELLAAGALAVDARAAEQYAAGHLPGAVSLPLESMMAGDNGLATALPAGRTLVVYCSGYGCTDSFDLAVLLLQAGYRDVRVFEGGVPAWREAGLPLVKGAA
ncbi:MAG: hypothetical protein A2091_06220 [Desulfuromonadales bacterium GWD2_61_12]|nr:MAG: hypothetical protein A2091_06220 [Desulfuromonadales bacterium GWD2_61_12]